MKTWSVRPLFLLFAIVMLVGAPLGRRSATAATIDVSKTMNIQVPAGTLDGKAILGPNQIDERFQKIEPEQTFPFVLQGNAASLPQKSLTAETANPALIPATATSKVTVGIAANVGGNVVVPVIVQATVTLPDAPKERTSALARARVVLAGTPTVHDLTINGIKITKPEDIKKYLTTLQTKGIVLDPIHLFARDLVTGETIDADVFRNAFTAAAGGSVGFDDADRFTLSILDDADVASLAAFSSETLVPYATDFTGTARLTGGVLTVTGLFDPGPGQPLSNFWDLTFSSTRPSFITAATLKSSVFDFSQMLITPRFTDPRVSDTDSVDFSISTQWEANFSSVPAPSAATLFLSGVFLITVIVLMRRRRSERLP